MTGNSANASRASSINCGDKGDLAKIADLFDNQQEIENDVRNYRQALRDYQQLRQEYAKLEDELQNNPKFGYGTGRQAAMVLSAFVSAMVVLIYLVAKMSGMGGLS
jgi:hypothetical protein